MEGTMGWGEVFGRKRCAAYSYRTAVRCDLTLNGAWCGAASWRVPQRPQFDNCGCDLLK